MIYRSILVAFFFILAQRAFAQRGDKLAIRSAKTADSSFWNAYNHCDVPAMMALTAHDIEFFHDKGGITRGDSAFEVSIRKGLCGSLDAFHLRREKVAGSEGVYPMKKDGKLYGMLFTGKHLFYIREPGKDEYADGLAQYADLWLLDGDKWKLGRVFSFDHQQAPYVNKRKAIVLSRAALQSFAGSYKGPQNKIRVIAGNNALELHLADNKQMTVYPLSRHLFFAKERDLIFEFKTQEGEVSAMIVREHGIGVEQLIKSEN
ncbi:hypothetical protein A8C56_10100 [Niabella ginsenosidivorans]|uniref:Uncharacterized protein n=1 Tax=Niabella ginsenosidivorans TaxID=1176587 RepID=A0A1A9I2J5_9BACT|nr:nuclear transport factor 2 family protein [Niabella ginsenosidivorans]ANH81289.1 hypothetical protein A8C56_10100 [Niabella ginsenosidivorans]